MKPGDQIIHELKEACTKSILLLVAQLLDIGIVVNEADEGGSALLRDDGWPQNGLLRHRRARVPWAEAMPRAQCPGRGARRPTASPAKGPVVVPPSSGSGSVAHWGTHWGPN